MLSLLCTLLRTARESTPRSLAGQLRFFRKFSLISEDSEHTLAPSAFRGFGGLDFDDCQTRNRQSSELDDCRSLWPMCVFFFCREAMNQSPLFLWTSAGLSRAPYSRSSSPRSSSFGTKIFVFSRMRTGRAGGWVAGWGRGREIETPCETEGHVVYCIS